MGSGKRLRGASALGRSRPGVNHAVVPWESVLPSQLGSERPHGVARSDVVKVAPTDRDASGHAWTIVLLGWSSVTALLIASSLIRITRCLRRAIRAQSATQPELDRLLHRLKTQLKVKRAARLVVTQAAIGPAVLGLVRPVILIPERILRGRSAEQLEPMLAHELLHIRRGDLWIGMLQVVAQAIWWFNPLVWYASRTISREAEPTRGSRFIRR